MNRRGFLRGLSACLLAIQMDFPALAPSMEKLFKGGNTLITPEWVTREIGAAYMNSLKFVKNLNRNFDAELA